MEVKLMNHFDIRRNLIVPNISDWSTLLSFEADLLILSKAGYATCVEIKVSKSDLKNDLKKNHISRIGYPHYFHMYYKNLKYFYYAVPKELEYCAINQIPDFFGLLVVEKQKDYYGEDVTIVEEIRKPRILFNEKWDDKQRYELARLGCMRILGLKRKLLNNNK